MMIEEVLLCIYGYIDISNDDKVKIFWENFIEIQSKIKSNQKIKTKINVYCKGDEELIELVYSPKFSILKNENKENYNETEYVERNYKLRSELIKSIEDDIGNVILKEYRNNESREDLKNIIYDDSLPNNYIYIMYDKDVDDGYKDEWIIIGNNNIKKFYEYDKFYNLTINKKNNYHEDVKIEWYFNSIKNRIKKIIISKIFKKIDIFLKKTHLINLLSNSNKKSFILLSEKIDQKFNPPILTSENTVNLINYKSKIKLSKRLIYSKYSIFKYFIIKNNLRNSVRFLDKSDFQIGEGTVINPLNYHIIILINNDVEINYIDYINQILELFEDKLISVYAVLSEGHSKIYEFPNFVKVIYDIRNLDKIISKLEICIFIPENYRINKDYNRVYFNTLIKYVKYTNNTIVLRNFNFLKIIDNEKFPGLKLIDDHNKYNLFPLIIRFDCLLKILNSNKNLFDIKVVYNKMSTINNKKNILFY